MFKKLFFFLFFLFCISFSNTIKAQIIKGQAIVGFNLSKVEGDRVNNGIIRFNKPGLNLGVGVLVPTWKNFDVNLEVLFTQKGAYRKHGPNADSAKPNYLTGLNYVEVPLLFQYTDRDRITIGTGFAYYRLVGVKWVVNGRTISDNVNDGYYSRDNLDWLVDVRFRIWEQLKFNVRYSFGLTSLWSGPDDALLETQAGEKQSAYQNNSMISFRLVWVFNEKQSSKNLDQP